jgi:hypothetical protein
MTVSLLTWAAFIYLTRAAGHAAPSAERRSRTPHRA